MSDVRTFSTRLNGLMASLNSAGNITIARGFARDTVALLAEFPWVSDFGPLTEKLNDAITLGGDVVVFKDQVFTAVNVAKKSIDLLSTTAKAVTNIRKKSGFTLGKDKFSSLYANSKSLAGGGTSFAGLKYTNVRGILVPKAPLYKNAVGYDTARQLVFQFNPEEISFSKDARYAVRDYTALNYNDYIWSGGGEKTTTFTMFLDETKASATPSLQKTATDPRGVLTRVELLESFVNPDTTDTNIIVPRFSEGGIVAPDQFVPPPILIFSYGAIYWEVLLKDIQVKYTTWAPNLTPLRAEVSVSLAVLEQVNVAPIDSIRKQYVSTNVLNAAFKNGLNLTP